MSKREQRAKDLAAANLGTSWDDLRPVQKDELRKQAEREGFTQDVDPTNAGDVVERQMRGRIDSLEALQLVVDGDADQADEQTVEGLDIGARYDDHELQCEPDQDAAQEALDNFALSIERREIFEIVFGTGGPDDRLICECNSEGNIEEIWYRFSWSGSASIKLRGSDYDVAERYAAPMIEMARLGDRE